MIDIWVDAVKKKFPLVVNYQKLERLICPHLLGKTGAGRYVLHAFQYGGQTSKGEIKDPSQGQWRFFYLDELEFVQIEAYCTAWHPEDLVKSDKEYTPPKFIETVIAMAE